MAEIIFNLQFCKTEFAKGKSNTFKQISTDDMLEYYERQEACDYTDTKYTNSSDAINYYNYRIGSNGGFNQNGSFSATAAKKLINQYKPKNMYRMVFSFEEDFLADYGFLSKKNIEKLITKSTDKNIRLMGLNPDNVVWGAYYHTNTDHPHIHLWMFEKKSTKDYLKLPKKTFKKIRSNIVRNMAINVEMYSIRDEVKKDIINHIKECGLDEKLFYKSNKLDKKIFCEDKTLTKMLLELEKNIPTSGSLKYNSNNIAPLRNQVDKIIDYVLNTDYISSYYNTYMELLDKERSMYNNRYFSDEEKFEQNKFIENKQNELKNRIGNMILQSIKNYRLDCSTYNQEKLKFDELNFNDTYSEKINARHSMQSRSSILNAGVLDELSKAIDEIVTSNNIIQYKLNEMIRKAENEIKTINLIL